MADQLTEGRYSEILPAAYIAAALEKNGKPSPIQVGLAIRDFKDLENPESPAFRIANAVKIACQIINVEPEVTSFGAKRFIITYLPLGKDKEQEQLRTPLFTDYRLGGATKAIWDRYDESGKNAWIGKRMILYKHNEKPKGGDKASAGYRQCVYAEPLNH